MEAKTIQLRGRGSLTLPARFRRRYNLEDGDPITVVDLDGALLLTPKIGLVPKLAAEIERHRIEAGLEVDDLLSVRPKKPQRSPKT